MNVGTFEDCERFILRVAVRQQAREHDSWFLICGKEGGGKSNLELLCIDAVDNIKSYNTPISHVGRNIKEFIDALEFSSNEEQVALDEGKELDSMRTAEGISKDLQSAGTVIRQKKLIVYITFTNPAKLQSYFSVDRIKGVFLIRHRGVCYYYTASHFAWVLEQVKKLRVKSYNSFFKHKPTFAFTFPKYEGRLKEEYLKRKTENIDTTLKELKEKYGSKVKYYSLKRGAEYLGSNVKDLKKWIDEGKLKAKKNLTGTQYRISEPDLQAFKLSFTNK